MAFSNFSGSCTVPSTSVVLGLCYNNLCIEIIRIQACFGISWKRLLQLGKKSFSTWVQPSHWFCPLGSLQVKEPLRFPRNTLKVQQKYKLWRCRKSLMHINSDKAWHKQFCWNSMLNLLRGNKKMDFYKSLQLESSETSHRYIWFLLRPHTTDTGFQLKAGMHALLSGAGDTRWQEQLLQKSHLSPSAIAQKTQYLSMQTLPKALMSGFASYSPL